MSLMFSIIVPTGEHRYTIKSTLDTILNQNGDDIEVLLSDNDHTTSHDQAYSYITDLRFRYIKTQERLSMTEHWNFAIQQARGEFIMIIGDDDGLMPNCIARTRRALKSYEVDVIFSDLNYYQWPVDGNSAYFINNTSQTGVDHLVDLNQQGQKVLARGGAKWSSLPGIYRSFIKRSLLDHIHQKTELICDTINPDMYTGFAIAGIANVRALKLGKPISVSGRSYGDKYKVIPKIYGKEKGGHELHLSEYDLTLSVKLPPYFPRVINSFAETMMLAINRFSKGYAGKKLDLSIHYAWMASGRKIGDLKDFWKEKKNLKKFGFHYWKFTIYFLIFRTAHFYSRHKIKATNNYNDKSALGIDNINDAIRNFSIKNS